MKTIFICAICAVVVGVAMFFAGRYSKIKTDTVTIRDTVLQVQKTEQVRTDTVWLNSTKVEIPIERKTYKTSDYRAVVEGFRPNLVEMEVYRQPLTPKPKRWGLGVQVGGGMTVTDGKIKAVPYVGIGVSYNLITW